MSLFPGDEFWYEAETAKHARSRCIASNCKEIIPKGELRVGVMCADKNDSHGWYHAVCLWENFGDKFNDNPRITKIEDIKNHDSLSAAVVTKIQELIDIATCSDTQIGNKRALPEETEALISKNTTIPAGCSHAPNAPVPVGSCVCQMSCPR